MAKLKTLKPKKCRSCGELFTPFSSLAKACSPKCALDTVKKTKQKEFDRETKRRKQALKSRGDWLKEAQSAVNSYVRARDSGKPCISCDKPDNGQHQRHASHYRSVGACSQLRFNTFNIHASCATCNSVLSGNLLEYRIRLVNKLGIDRVAWLERQNDIARYDIEYLKRIKSIFLRRTKILSA